MKPAPTPVTLEQFIAMIPCDQRHAIEDDIARLIAEGWGELTFSIVHHNVTGHIVTVSRVYNRMEKE